MVTELECVRESSENKKYGEIKGCADVAWHAKPTNYLPDGLIEEQIIRLNANALIRCKRAVAIAHLIRRLVI